MLIHLRKNFLFKLINYMKVRKVDVRIGVKLMSFYGGIFLYRKIYNKIKPIMRRFLFIIYSCNFRDKNFAFLLLTNLFYFKMDSDHAKYKDVLKYCT